MTFVLKGKCCKLSFNKCYVRIVDLLTFCKLAFKNVEDY